MKPKILAMVLLMSFALFSCKKETVSDNSPGMPPAEAVLKGNYNPGNHEWPVYQKYTSWKVGKFMYDGYNEAQQFSNYRLDFRVDNRVAVVNLTDYSIFYGDWYMKDINHLSLLFYPDDVIQNGNGFNKLNGVWTIVKYSLTSFEMEGNEPGVHKELRIDRF